MTKVIKCTVWWFIPQTGVSPLCCIYCFTLTQAKNQNYLASEYTPLWDR